MSGRSDQLPGEQAFTLSALIRQLAETSGEQISLEHLLARFGRRAFGAALFVFAAPNLLPLPPGSSSVLALPLLLIAPQLAIGRSRPWLPRWLRRQTVGRSLLAEVSGHVGPWLVRVERLSTRRLGFLFGGAGDVTIGLTCTGLAAVLILPIPLGNLLPATAVTILGLSLVQRDGILALVGYLVAAASVAVLAAGGHVVVAATRELIGWFVR